MRRFSGFFILFFCVLSLFRPTFSRADAFETAGDAGALAVPLAAGAMTLVFDDEEGAKSLLKAFGLAVSSTLAIKQVVSEQRPNGEGDDAFPSLHTSSAFAGAAFIQRRYGWDYGIPAYMIASLVGASRVESEDHYLHDVLAGAAIGIGANFVFTKPYKNISVAPVAAGGFYGIVIGGRF